MYPASELNVRIVWTFEKRTAAGWTDIRNNTRGHSFYWIHEGTGMFFTEAGQSILAQAGMLFYMEPDFHLKMESSIDEPLTISMVLFDCLRLNWNKQDAPLSASGVAKLNIPFISDFRGSGPYAMQIDTLLSELTSSWIPGDPGRELESASLLLRLLAWLHQDRHEPGRPGAIESFKTIKRELEQHYSEPLHIQKLAQKHAISPSYLRKLFLEFTGMAPKDYLTGIRIQYAERYLIYTPLPLKQIAAACGFNDEFHLSKTFKVHKGESPASYRKRKKPT